MEKGQAKKKAHNPRREEAEIPNQSAREINGEKRAHPQRGPSARLQKLRRQKTCVKEKSSYTSA